MKTTLIITDMVCPSCVMFLENLPLRMAGVKKASANLKKQTLKVDFDEKQLTLEQVVQVISGYGYHPQVKAEEQV